MNDVERKRIMDHVAGQADHHGMVEVVAAIDGLTDNGHTYRKDDVLHMHVHLIPAHWSAGQIAVKGLTAAGAKQAATPADKQQAGSANKGG